MTSTRRVMPLSSTHAHGSRWAATVSACLLLACGGGQPDAPPTPRPRGPTSFVPEQKSETLIAPSTAAYQTKKVPVTEPPPTAAAPDAPVKPEEKRDFSRELLQKMSGAASCLKPRVAQTALSHIDIALTANVTPSGAVSRGEVSAAALDADERSCVRRQLEALHFAAPIEDAPFPVRATLGVDQAPPPPVTPAPAGAQPPSNAAPAAQAPTAAPSAP